MYKVSYMLGETPTVVFKVFNSIEEACKFALALEYPKTVIEIKFV